MSGVELGLRTEAGTWADGRYTASFTTPERGHACALQVPVDLPVAPTWSKVLACTSDADAEGAGGRFTGSLQRVAACDQPRGVDPKSPECERSADHYVLRARFDAFTPDSLRIRVQRDGAPMFETLRTLRYESWYPNGPECTPACKSSTVDLTMP